MFALLASLDRNLGYREEQVSSTNPFVVETINSSGRVIETRPNWALIIPLVLVALIAVIALLVYLYRRHCISVRVAGKTLYAMPGETLKSASENGLWFDRQKERLSERGIEVEGWYTDPNLTIPLDLNRPTYTPVTIFPKVKKK